MDNVVAQAADAQSQEGLSAGSSEKVVSSLTGLIEQAQRLDNAADEAELGPEGSEVLVSDDVVEGDGSDAEGDGADPESEEEEAEGEEDDPDAEPLINQEAVNKRISKEVGRRKAAEERAQEAAAEVQRLQMQLAQASQVDLSPALSALGMNEFLALDPQGLVVAEKQAKAAVSRLRAASYNPDGIDEGDVHYTQEQVIGALTAYEGRLEAMQEARFVVGRRMQVDAEAQKAFPELFAPHSPEALACSNAMRQVPGLSALPNAKVLIAHMLIGQRVAEALGQGEPVMPKLKALLKGFKPGAEVKQVPVTRPKQKPSPAVTPKAKPAPAPSGGSGYDPEAVRQAGTLDALLEQAKKL